LAGKRRELTGSVETRNCRRMNPPVVPDMGESSRDRPEVTPKLQVAANEDR